MGKIVKGIVLGAAVGAGIRVAQDLRSEDDLGAIAPRVAKTAGEAALAGAAVGVVLTARDRRRMKKMAKSAKAVAKMRNLAETGLQVAVPALQHAASTARPHVIHAMEEARERAHELSDAARPHLESAGKKARKRYEKEMKKNRPKVEKAARDARERAATVADLAAERAKRKLADLDLPTTIIAV
ncbi:MAG TPA: hypothetical protein VFU93_11430 [Acidimicrobiales bacterium]|nr:hypothetical protein [Acidimicrobiales bacterium]